MGAEQENTVCEQIFCQFFLSILEKKTRITRTEMTHKPSNTALSLGGR